MKNDIKSINIKNFDFIIDNKEVLIFNRNDIEENISIPIKIFEELIGKLVFGDYNE